MDRELGPCSPALRLVHLARRPVAVRLVQAFLILEAQGRVHGSGVGAVCLTIQGTEFLQKAAESLESHD